MPQAAPVGIFDSGVGGLSVVRELMRQYPAQPFIYLADQAHVPYGARQLAEIQAFSEGITRALLAAGACIIVVACNAASAAALRRLRECFPTVPFVGMEPAVKPAAEGTRCRHVGVIATAATFQGELFASLLDRYSPRVTVHTQVCPDLVPLIEAGELSSPRTRLAVQGYLAPLLAAGIDQLVLGCTHYPFLRPLIEEAAGPSVTIIDPAPAVARQAGRLLGQHGWLAGDGRQPSGADPQGAPAKHLFLTTGDPVRFRCAVKDLLGLDTGVRRAVWSAAPEPALEVARDE